MKTKLTWKRKWLDDKSGSWYSAKVPFLGWEYIVENKDEKLEYNSYLFLSSKDAEDVKITKKTVKTKEVAMNICEKHLNNTAKKFIKWVNTK